MKRGNREVDGDGDEDDDDIEYNDKVGLVEVRAVVLYVECNWRIHFCCTPLFFFKG